MANLATAVGQLQTSLDFRDHKDVEAALCVVFCRLMPVNVFYILYRTSMNRVERRVALDLYFIIPHSHPLCVKQVLDPDVPDRSMLIGLYPSKLFLGKA